MTTGQLWVGDVIVLLATVAATLSVVGVVRYPSTYAKIHAASALALVAVLLTSSLVLVTGEPKMIARGALVAAFLLLTSPVSSHALARFVWLRNPERNPERNPK